MGTTEVPGDSSDSPDEEPPLEHTGSARTDVVGAADADADGAAAADADGDADGDGAADADGDEVSPVHRVRVLSPAERRAEGGGRSVRFARPVSMGWQRTALSVVGLGAVIGLLAWAVDAGMADPDAARTSTSDPASSTSTTVETTTTTTTTPPPTTAAPRPIDLEADGQGCTQLANKGYSYADALSYYLRTGEPERMDPDDDDMPCESNYTDDEKSEVWTERQAAGESVPIGAL